MIIVKNTWKNVILSKELKNNKNILVLIYKP